MCLYYNNIPYPYVCVPYASLLVHQLIITQGRMIDKFDLSVCIATLLLLTLHLTSIPLIESMSSSSSKPRWIYDVFLNFRGEDTRGGFVSHLHAALSNAGVNTFIDDKIPKGETLPTELSRAIEWSQMSIVVFSENYAASSWCLYELEKIMECQTIGQLVMPVFYHVEPSDVRHQKGAFGDAFDKLAAKFSESGKTDRVSGWKRALEWAIHFSGWHLRNSSAESESEMAEKIVDEVLRKKDSSLPITDYPVGLKSRVQDVIQFLQRESTRVRIVGIWGMGGSGKTTMAKAIYNKIHRSFRNRSFIANIRDVWEEDIRGRTDLQKQLLSDIHKIEKLKIHSIEKGKNEIKGRLCNKKALLIFDDLNNSEQLNALCVTGIREWIGPGSVIIVTTRDLCLLKSNRLDTDHICQMTEMDPNESLKLFSWHAFKEESPTREFIELSKRVVEYCEVLPLALEVLGSYLDKRTKLEWECVLSKLEAIPHAEIQEKLRISYDGLGDNTMQEIFLDICCFFIGEERAYVTRILNGCDLFADIGITILIERSLIRVEKGNKLGMHALLRDMGREIVRCSSPKELGERSRLWSHKDVLDVLTQNTGAKAIEGLALKLQRRSGVSFEADAILKMKRLRLLKLDHVHLNGDYGYLSKDLKWVSWQGFPLKYMPDSFNQRKVVAFDLRHSNLKLVWKAPKMLECLKILNLSHSRCLSKTPDFSYLPNLEKLILKDCPSLTEAHQSIGDLNKILLINLKGCTSLSNLPRVAYKLKTLKTLILSGCSKIDKLEEDIEQMESLTTLTAENTAVKQVPFSIVRLKGIGHISLCGYEGLARDVFPSLILAWTSLTTNPLSRIDPFGSLSSSLVSLDVPNSSLGDLSMLSDFSKLRCLWVQCHSEFQLSQDLERILGDVYGVNFTKLERTSYASEISEHSLRSLLIGMGSYHQVIDTLSKTISQELVTSRSGNVCLPGDNYPHWLMHRGEGHSVLFKVPKVSDCSMKGMILCVVYSSLPESMAAECLTAVAIINYTKCTIQLYKRDTVMSFNDEDWQGILSNLGPDDKVEILVAFGHRLTVNSTAVYLIYGESVDLEKELSQRTKKRKLSNSELK